MIYIKKFLCKFIFNFFKRRISIIKRRTSVIPIIKISHKYKVVDIFDMNHISRCLFFIYPMKGNLSLTEIHISLVRCGFKLCPITFNERK